MKSTMQRYSLLQGQRVTVLTLSALVALGSVNLAQLSLAQQYIPSQSSPGALLSPSVDAAPPSTAAPGNDLNAPTSQPTIEQNGTDLQQSAQPALPESEQTLFQANKIEVEGNTILKTEEVRKIVAPYEGRSLNPEELSALIGQLNEAYRKRGFLTTLAFIPPQDLERGTITVKVLEGTIGGMEVTGNKYFRSKVIANRIMEKPGDKLNLPELEKELLQINRTEPYRIKAVLAPGEKTGETRVRLEVKEQQPYQVALTFDNAGRPYIGTYRSGIELIDRNVTGYGDRFSARYLVGAGQHIVTSAYTLPVGRHGTEISALFGYSHVNVDLETPNQPNLTGDAFNYGLLLSQPFDRERVWVGDIGLNARRASSYYNDDRTARDDIRSLTVGLNYNKYDRLGRTFARVQNSFAPKILGANTSFWKIEGFTTRVTRLPKNNLLLLSGYGQYSPTDLPPIEQFQLGGVNSVRGYTQGLMFGDRGYNVTAEWRWPVPFLSKASPWLAERLQGAFFVDYGQTWLDKDNRYLIAGRTNGGKTSLMGAGVGVRYHLTQYLQGYVDAGWGLLNRKEVEPNYQPTVRIHFGIRSELLSNDYKSRTDVVTPIKTNHPVARPKSVGVLHQQPLESEVADPTLAPVEKVSR